MEIVHMQAQMYPGLQNLVPWSVKALISYSPSFTKIMDFGISIKSNLLSQNSLWSMWERLSSMNFCSFLPDLFLINV